MNIILRLSTFHLTIVIFRILLIYSTIEGTLLIFEEWTSISFVNTWQTVRSYFSASQDVY